jgi:hypothetical protein
MVKIPWTYQIRGWAWIKIPRACALWWHTQNSPPDRKWNPITQPVVSHYTDLCIRKKHKWGWDYYVYLSHQAHRNLVWVPTQITKVATLSLESKTINPWYSLCRMELFCHLWDSWVFSSFFLLLYISSHGLESDLGNVWMFVT